MSGERSDVIDGSLQEAERDWTGNGIRKHQLVDDCYREIFNKDAERAGKKE